MALSVLKAQLVPADRPDLADPAHHLLLQDLQDPSSLGGLVVLVAQERHPLRQDHQDQSTLEDLVDLVAQERHPLRQDPQDPEHLCDLEDLRARWDLADQ